MNSLFVLSRLWRPSANSLTVLLWPQRPLLTSLCLLFQLCQISLGGPQIHSGYRRSHLLCCGALQLHLFRPGGLHLLASPSSGIMVLCVLVFLYFSLLSSAFLCFLFCCCVWIERHCVMTFACYLDYDCGLPLNKQLHLDPQLLCPRAVHDSFPFELICYTISLYQERGFIKPLFFCGYHFHIQPLSDDSLIYFITTIRGPENIIASNIVIAIS